MLSHCWVHVFSFLRNDNFPTCVSFFLLSLPAIKIFSAHFHRKSCLVVFCSVLRLSILFQCSLCLVSLRFFIASHFQTRNFALANNRAKQVANRLDIVEIQNALGSTKNKKNCESGTCVFQCKKWRKRFDARGCKPTPINSATPSFLFQPNRPAKMLQSPKVFRQ